MAFRFFNCEVPLTQIHILTNSFFLFGVSTCWTQTDEGSVTRAWMIWRFLFFCVVFCHLTVGCSVCIILYIFDYIHAELYIYIYVVYTCPDTNKNDMNTLIYVYTVLITPRQLQFHFADYLKNINHLMNHSESLWIMLPSCM